MKPPAGKCHQQTLTWHFDNAANGDQNDASTTYEDEPNPEPWRREALMHAITEETSAALVEWSLSLK